MRLVEVTHTASAETVLYVLGLFKIPLQATLQRGRWVGAQVGWFDPTHALCAPSQRRLVRNTY